MLDIQKNINMKNTILIFCIALVFSIKGQSQNIEPHVFLVKNNSSISKEDLIKIGKLNISDTSFSIISFSYIITGKRNDGNLNPTFGVNKSSIFSTGLLKELNNSQSQQSSLYITDIIVHHLKKNFGKDKKINQDLRINF